MTSGSKLALFFVCATVFNLVVMGVLVVVFWVLAALIPIEVLSLILRFAGLFGAIILTFLIYSWVMKRVSVRWQLEKHIPQLFRGKRKG